MSKLTIEGMLTSETAPVKWEQGQKWIKNLNTDGQIDLKEVTQSDSVGVALLIAWTRFAKQQNHSISFINLPPQLLTIARLSNLDTILPIR